TSLGRGCSPDQPRTWPALPRKAVPRRAALCWWFSPDGIQQDCFRPARTAGLLPTREGARRRRVYARMRSPVLAWAKRQNAPSADGALELSRSRQLNDLGEDDY